MAWKSVHPFFHNQYIWRCLAVKVKWLKRSLGLGKKTVPRKLQTHCGLMRDSPVGTQQQRRRVGSTAVVLTVTDSDEDDDDNRPQLCPLKQQLLKRISRNAAAISSTPLVEPLFPTLGGTNTGPLNHDPSPPASLLTVALDQQGSSVYSDGKALIQSCQQDKHNAGAVLLGNHHGVLRVQDVARMSGTTWLGDESLNCYFGLIQRRADLWNRGDSHGARSQRRASSSSSSSSSSRDEAREKFRHLSLRARRRSSSLPSRTATVLDETKKEDKQHGGSGGSHLSGEDDDARRHRYPSSRRHPWVAVLLTFFYPLLCQGPKGYNYAAVRRWTLPHKFAVHPLDRDIILIPINHGPNLHWVLAALFPATRCIVYLDSMQGKGLSGRREAQQVGQTLQRWIRDEIRDKTQRFNHPRALRHRKMTTTTTTTTTTTMTWDSQQETPPPPPPPEEEERRQHHLQRSLDPTETWKFIIAEGLPRQTDGGSCGAFVCTYAERLAAGVDWRQLHKCFNQGDMARLRVGIVVDIIRQALSPFPDLTL